jgi:hypothetical protein
MKWFGLYNIAQIWAKIYNTALVPFLLLKMDEKLMQK